MTKRWRAATSAALILIGLGSATMANTFASAQVALPEAKPPDGAALFKTQCAVCHTINASDPSRQGPTLAKIVGRKAGSVDGFKYSAGFSKADFAWDEAKLDAWLTNPQVVIPGAIMAYKQAKPEVRAALITYLKGLN